MHITKAVALSTLFILFLLPLTMLSLLRPALLQARQSITKAMSTLTPGQILRGPNWDYEVSEILKGDGSHRSIVAKAAVIPHDGKAAHQHPQLFVISHPN
jgi:hypothetical protein